MFWLINIKDSYQVCTLIKRLKYRMLSNFRNNVNSGQAVEEPYNFILDLHCLEFVF